MDNKKKKIILGALISAVVLGGVATSAYFLMNNNNGEDAAQEVRFNSSGNKDAKLVESKDGSTSSISSSTENKKSDDKKDEKDKDKDQNSGSQTSSNSRRDDRRDSVPITESRLNNTREAGSRPIAPISQVRDLVSRPNSVRTNGSSTTATPGSTPIGTNAAVSKIQDAESRRLAELEKRNEEERQARLAQAQKVRDQDTSNTATPSAPINPTPAPDPTPEPAPETPTPAPNPVPETPTPAPEKPSAPVEVPENPTPAPAPTPSVPSNPDPSPAPEKPTETKPADDNKKPDKKPKEDNTKIQDGQEQNVALTITSQEELDNYLKRTGTDLAGDKIIFDLKESIKFPTKTFKVQNGETLWSFKGNGKAYTIDLGDSTFLQGIGGDFFWLGTGVHGDEKQSTTIKNGHFYGSVKTDTTENGSISSPELPKEKHPSIFNKGMRNGYGMFMGQFLKASYLTFQDLDFNNVHHEDAHVFDLSGSDHIRFENNVFAGYGGKEFTDSEIAKRFSKNPHSVYSEAIQIDSAINGTFGDLEKKGTILDGIDYNGTPSSHITVENNAFTTYSGLDAEGIITGKTDRKVVRNYSAGVGSHTRGKEDYHDIAIRNNRFENTSDFKDNGHNDRHLAYPIHLDGVSDLEKNKIFVVGNSFSGINPKLDSGVVINKRVGFTAIMSGASTEAEKQPKTNDEAEKMREEALKKSETPVTSPETLKPTETKPAVPATTDSKPGADKTTETKTVNKNFTNDKAKEAFDAWVSERKITGKEKELLATIIQKESNWKADFSNQILNKEFYGLLAVDKTLLSKEALTNPYKQLDEFYEQFVKPNHNSILVTVIKTHADSSTVAMIRKTVTDAGGIDAYLASSSLSDIDKAEVKKVYEALN